MLTFYVCYSCISTNIQFKQMTQATATSINQPLPISVKHFSVTFLNSGTLRNCKKKTAMIKY